MIDRPIAVFLPLIVPLDPLKTDYGASASRRARTTSWAPTCRAATSSRAWSTARGLAHRRVRGGGAVRDRRDRSLGLVAGFSGRAARPAAHALHGHAPGDPAAPAVHRVHLDRRAGARVGDRGHRAARLAAHGPPGPRPAAVAPRGRVRHRDPGRRRREREIVCGTCSPTSSGRSPWSPRSAWRGDPAGGVPVVPGPRRAAAGAEPGRDDQRGDAPRRPPGRCPGSGCRRGSSSR